MYRNGILKPLESKQLFKAQKLAKHNKCIAHGVIIVAAWQRLNGYSMMGQSS